MTTMTQLPLFETAESVARATLETARRHAETTLLGMRSSAQLCASDAATLLERGEFKRAFERSLSSLGYSVGIFSPDYRQHALKLGVFF